MKEDSFEILMLTIREGSQKINLINYVATLKAKNG